MSAPMTMFTAEPHPRRNGVFFCRSKPDGLHDSWVLKSHEPRNTPNTRKCAVFSLFDGSLKAEDLYRKISAYDATRRLLPGRTLIFLDEIQECPNARTALKSFALERDGGIVPVEVKASNGATISLNELLEKPQVPYGYKLVDGNLGVMGKKITLPHYMAMFI